MPTTAARTRADGLADQRRTDILAAAVDCIAERGFDAVRLRDVSRAAGVSIGLIQHYFDSRDELLEQAIGHLSMRLIDAFDRGISETDDEWSRLEMLVDLLCAVPDLGAHATMWVVFAAAVSQYPHLQPHLVGVYDAWADHVRNAVVDGIASGAFDPTLDLDDAVAVYLAFFDGYEYEMATGLVPVDPPELRRRALGLAAALFRPRR